MYLGITDFYKIRKKVAEIILPPEIGFLPPDPPAKISMSFTLLDKKVAVIILPPEVRVFAAGSAGKNINDFYPIKQKSCGNYFSYCYYSCGYYFYRRIRRILGRNLWYTQILQIKKM